MPSLSNSVIPVTFSGHPSLKADKAEQRKDRAVLSPSGGLLSFVRSASARSAEVPRVRSLFAWPAELLLLLIALVALWLSLAPALALSVDVGSDGSELAYVSGTYQRERVESRTFRWVSGDATFTLPVGRVGPLVLEAHLHGAPTPNRAPLPTLLGLPTGQALRFVLPDAQRIYRIPLASSAAPNGVLRLSMAGDTIVAEGDNRPIAFALDRLTALPLGGAGQPALPLIAAEALLLAALVATLGALGAARPVRLATGAALAGALVYLNLAQRLWIAAAAWPLGLGALVVCGLALFVQPALARALAAHTPPLLAQRERGAGGDGLFSPANARLLGLIVLAGAALRLLGSLAPGYAAHDLDVQSEQFITAGNGLLYFTRHAHEYGQGATFYPPGPYVLMLPLLTLLSTAQALQVGVALIDALGPALLALLARRLGASQRTALIAAALFCMLPISLTALWWGFMTNSAGQTLLLLFLLALLIYADRPSARAALFLTVAAVLAILSHVGVLLQLGVLLALLAIFDFGLPILDFRRNRSRSHNRKSKIQNLQWLLPMLAGAAVVALLYLSVVVPPMLLEARAVFAGREAIDAAKLASDRAYIVGAMPRALGRGFVGVVALLALPGLALMWRRAPSRLGRGLILAWALTPLLFFAVDVAFILQVRYLFFAAPLCCLAAAAVLGRLPGRSGRAVAIVAVALVFAIGTALWLNGTVAAIKPSLLPLTH